MINVIDVIQGKFIQEFSAISMSEILVAITLSFVLSLFIVYIYRMTYAGVNFSSSFAGAGAGAAVRLLFWLFLICSRRAAD